MRLSQKYIFYIVAFILVLHGIFPILSFYSKFWGKVPIANKDCCITSVNTVIPTGGVVNGYTVSCNYNFKYKQKEISSDLVSFGNPTFKSKNAAEKYLLRVKEIQTVRYNNFLKISCLTSDINKFYATLFIMGLIGIVILAKIPTVK
jgi:hypothetical protein